MKKIAEDLIWKGFAIFIFVILIGGTIAVFLMPIREIPKDIQVFYSWIYIFGMFLGLSFGMMLTAAIIAKSKKKKKVKA